MQYRKLFPYRYLVVADAEVPILSPRLRGALYSFPPLSHPFFEIRPHGVTAKSNYAWDGATGAIFQTPDLIIPSLIHDIGCQAINMELLPRRLRPQFDKEYYLQCKHYGVCEIRAQIHYAAITLWGLVPKKEPINPKYARTYFVSTGDL